MSMARGGVESPRAVVVAESDEPRRPPIDPVRPDGSLSRTVALEKTREMERFAANKSIGAGEFGTIFLSASYDRFPVLAYFHYLAPYLIHFDLALVRAEQAIGAGAVLDHYYFSGLDGQFFEFKSPSGSVLLNSKTFEATSLEKLKDSKISPVHPPTGAAMLQHNREMTRTEISKEWEKLSSEIGSK